MNLSNPSFIVYSCFCDHMVRCRYGYVHVFNNDYDGWAQYAIGGSAGPTIISQGNRFRASGSSVKEVINCT